MKKIIKRYLISLAVIIFLLLISFIFKFHFAEKDNIFLAHSSSSQCIKLSKQIKDTIFTFSLEVIDLKKDEWEQKDQIENDDDFLDDFIEQTQLRSKFPSLEFIHFSNKYRPFSAIPLYILFHSWKSLVY